MSRRPRPHQEIPAAALEPTGNPSGCGWISYSDGRWSRTSGKVAVVTRRRADESDLVLFDRLRWGRFDALVVDMIAALTGNIPTGTLNQYRSDLNVLLLPRIGDLWLVDADDDAHADLIDKVISATNAGRLDAAERTLGVVISWAHEKGRWPKGRPAFGGREARFARVKSKKAAQPADIADVKGLISLEDCPTYGETCAYGAAVGDAAAQQWGEPARVLGELPKIQYLIGGRISATFASHAAGFQLSRRTFHVVHQIDRSKSWPDISSCRPNNLAAYKPPLILDKNKLPTGRYARLWGWGLPYLEDFFSRAARERGGWAFATVLDSKRPLDRVEKLLRDVRHDPAVNYRWTSHYHRHAYASLNLATKHEGGYNRSVATVAGWIGDGIALTQRTYWHGTSEPEDGWSDRPPPIRATD